MPVVKSLASVNGRQVATSTGAVRQSFSNSANSAFSAMFHDTTTNGSQCGQLAHNRPGVHATSINMQQNHCECTTLSASGSGAPGAIVRSGPGDGARHADARRKCRRMMLRRHGPPVPCWSGVCAPRAIGDFCGQQLDTAEQRERKCGGKNVQHQSERDRRHSSLPGRRGRSRRLFASCRAVSSGRWSSAAITRMPARPGSSISGQVRLRNCRITTE